jgi:hypothetical protein
VAALRAHLAAAGAIVSLAPRQAGA